MGFYQLTDAELDAVSAGSTRCPPPRPSHHGSRGDRQVNKAIVVGVNYADDGSANTSGTITASGGSNSVNGGQIVTQNVNQQNFD